ncbi:exodeoxyribonuclease V subunit beta [Alteromonas sp. ASW11-19]|uniref:RecBCD enzyme subunit RecB n=1 Tax=Alteromonas salexigens TaxID=2982530 RepID=A0ABT2VRS1_9ALTE|nr:exodeoxyribonuclease V subunit beta [Alteromonas salexigens]MCU7555825.1 exodeoxyribonuclease V subunit beta [Alteromonas salexigens]
MTQQTLNVPAMPLSGRHLIEASAGTGKTYNITRLYVRLLLEKALPVQQILVMTFTNAATEEIRGRLADTLREVMSFWQEAMESPETTLPGADPVYRHLFKQCDPQQGLAMLQAALLEMDDAAVFTIHGFCNKVLGQLAFDSGTAMAQSLATDTRDMYLEAASDWIRLQARDSDAYALLVAQGWHQPDTLLQQFERPARSDLLPRVSDEATVRNEAKAAHDAKAESFAARFAEVRNTLLEHEAMLLDALVNSCKKAADTDTRQREWEVLLQWLSSPDLVAPPPEIGKFVNGNRYRNKPDVKAVLDLVKELAASVKAELGELEKSLDNQLAALPSLQLVAQAIAYIRQHVAAQKRRLGVLDFDDLIVALAAQVQQPDSSVTGQLRQLYPVALIDEFQDTDANQYAILDTVYPAGHSHHCLMMIGDPKQAIYGFRGGDIFTYLKAGQHADYRWVMDTNWRSVAPMVAAYNRLFYGAPLANGPADVFGFNITYEPVNATQHAKAAATPLADPAPHRAAMNYALLVAEEDRKPAKAQLQHHLADWMTGEVSRLLAQATLGERPVLPSDIAVLVRSTTEAQVVKQSLARAGLSAVFLSDKTNLFASPQASDIYRVLDGIWHWDNHARLSASLSSPLFGYTHQQLVDILHHEKDSLWEALISRLQQLRQMWTERGCMSVLLYLMQNYYQGSADNPERELTNYLHLAEVLEREAAAHARPDQLLLWLHRQVADPQARMEQVQRLESDATLIQIVTQHGSKGLEYPIVFVPFASDYRDPAKAGQQWAAYYQFFDDATQQLAIQLGHSHTAVNRVRAEGDAEAMRLLYVAVTRAAHRCYLGVAPFKDSQNSALARALGVTSEQEWHTRLTELAAEQDVSSVCIDVSEAAPPATQNAAQADELTDLIVREFTGKVDEAWRLYSFSALARQQVVVRQSDRELEDIAQSAPPMPTPVVADSQFRFGFEKGANAGNLLHDILELTDFSSPDWEAASHEPVQRFGLAADQHALLFEWLQDTLNAPLTPADWQLADKSPEQTLREAEFYFPMTNLKWSKLAAVLRSHRDSLADIAAPVPVPALHQYDLEGMMHGFIDLIVEHDGRYYVADYKSTWLGAAFDDYSMAAMTRNNQQHLYDLQYLIYALSLHRYLTLALPGYEPAQHFGGVYYLYLRGMSAQHPGAGVFYTPLSPTLLDALDNAFGTVDAGEVPA